MAERDILRKAWVSTGRDARTEEGLWHRPGLLDSVADILLFLAAIALAWAFVIWLTSRPFFPLREVVVVTPPGHVTSDQIAYAARSSIHGNFFTVGLVEVRESLERLPWVRRAEVRRRWPDALELRLEEHQAAAFWQAVGSDDIQLVNNRGEVFAATSSAGLPTFSGPQGSAAYLFMRHREFLQLIAPLGRELRQVKLSARDAWQLELDDGLVILLGRDRERAPVADRLAEFVRHWPQASEQVGIEVAIADVRYQRGFALTPAALPTDRKGTQ